MLLQNFNKLSFLVFYGSPLIDDYENEKQKTKYPHQTEKEITIFIYLDLFFNAMSRKPLSQQSWCPFIIGLGDCFASCFAGSPI